MTQTTKGLNIFDGTENFDVADFNNANMNKLNDLITIDILVNSESNLPTASSANENKWARIKDTGKIVQSKKICSTTSKTEFAWCLGGVLYMEIRSDERPVSEMIQGIIYAQLEEA